MWLQLKISIKILIHNTFKYLLQHPLKKKHANEQECCYENLSKINYLL